MEGEKEIILITGASGRIGFKSAEFFSKDFRIIGFDIFLAGHLPGVEFVIVDLATDESTKEGLNYVQKNYGNKIASVIHLAAYYSFSSQHSSLYDRITVQGTERLLKGLQQFDVDQFIFSSTMLVHKPTRPGVKITEDSPVAPTWDYPASKVKTEAIIHKERGKISTVILRIAGVYDDRCHSIPLSNQIQRIIEDSFEAHVFSGDVTHGAAFIHMDDLIEAIALCVQKRKTLPPELTLLIGEEVTLSYDQLQRMMQKLIHGKEWKTWSVPKPLAKIGAWAQEHLLGKQGFIKPWMIEIADDHYELDITKAKQMIGWQPRHRVEQGVVKWVQEIQTDPVEWYDENKLKVPHGLAQMVKR
jgi:nucleoside-diphosphate-sugar epimerase